VNEADPDSADDVIKILMKILFFLEPFPVRRRPLDYLWVADRWHATGLELLKLGAQVRWAVSDEVAAARPRLEAVSPRSLGFDLAPTESDTLSDADWTKLMREPDCAPWHSVISAMLDTHQPDAVVTWTVNAPLRSECERRDLVLMHQELGPLRTPLVPLFFADPRGVNGASSVQALWPSLCAEPWTARREAELESYLKRCYPIPEAAADVQRELRLDPDRPVIAVFGQVPRDSNILAWSRIDGAGLVAAVRDAAKAAGIQVVHKRHPTEPDLPLPEGVLAAPPAMSARALVAAADSIATINSSTAIEGLLQARPVYLFGDSPFSGMGATRDVSGDPAALADQLRRAPKELDSEEDMARRRLLHFLLLRYFRSDAELADAHSLLDILESWRALRDRRAPPLDWFPSSRIAARLREDYLVARELATASDVATARSALTDRERESERLRRALSDARAELEQSSAAHQRELDERRGAEAELRRVQEEQERELDKRRAMEAELRRAMREQQRELIELKTALEMKRSALDASGEALRAKDAEVMELRGELRRIEESAGLRAVNALRRIPGVYAGYLLAKRVAKGRS
jgi:flagellar biosynthesis GTPase FlhF